MNSKYSKNFYKNILHYNKARKNKKVPKLLINKLEIS